MANETIMRFQIADYLGIPGDSDTTYALMGAGFNTLDENPAAQLGMVRRVFWGRMFPLFPLVGGVFLPQFVLTPPVDRTVALLFALVLVTYGAVFLQFARQYLRLRRAV